MAGYDQSIYRMYLAEVPMFARCSNAQLDLVATLGEADSYAPGDDIVREGDDGGGFFVLIGGRARVRRGGPHRARPGTRGHLGGLSPLPPAPPHPTGPPAHTAARVGLSPPPVPP